MARAMAIPAIASRVSVGSSASRGSTWHLLCSPHMARICPPTVLTYTPSHAGSATHGYFSLSKRQRSGISSLRILRYETVCSLKLFSRFRQGRQRLLRRSVQLVHLVERLLPNLLPHHLPCSSRLRRDTQAHYTTFLPYSNA